MRLAILKERRAGEARVAATPATIAQLRGLGYDVVVESEAGAKASFPDEAYAAADARIGSESEAWQADIVFKVNAPSVEEIGKLLAGYPEQAAEIDELRGLTDKLGTTHGPAVLRLRARLGELTDLIRLQLLSVR